MTDKLGPCPLCGGEATKYWETAECSQCRLSGIVDTDWNRLSAIAAQNRRRGEALEKLKKWAGKIGYPDWVKLCEEALK